MELVKSLLLRTDVLVMLPKLNMESKVEPQLSRPHLSGFSVN